MKKKKYNEGHYSDYNRSNKRHIKRGSLVEDLFGNKGVVVNIILSTEDFHGHIAVWLENETNYGADNCEHYPYNTWRSLLRS